MIRRIATLFIVLFLSVAASAQSIYPPIGPGSIVPLGPSVTGSNITQSFQCNFTAGTFSNCQLSVSTPAGYAPNASGLLISFAGNVIRSTNAGILIEPASTNLVLQSATLGTTWALNSANITRSQNAIDPTGAANKAWSLIVTSGDATTNDLTQSVTVPSNVLDYVQSVYVQRSFSDPGVCPASVTSFSGGSSRTSVFNTFTGSVTDVSTAGSTALVWYGNYWLNATVLTNTSKTAMSPNLYPALNSSTTGSCTSASRVDATNGTTVFDFVQIEQGEQPTSPCTTTTTSCTRAADIVTVTGQAFNAAQGASLAVDSVPGVALLTVPTVTALQVDDGTANNILAFVRDTSRHARIQVTAGGTLVANVDLGLWSDLAENVMVASINGTVLRTSINGGAPTTTIMASSPANMSNTRIGAVAAGPTGVVTVKNVTAYNGAL